MNYRTTKVLLVVGCALLIAFISKAGGQNAGASSGYPVAAESLNPEEQRGHGLYLRYCVGCHGVRGDGNGENAPYLDPRPRDFTSAAYK